MSLADDFAEYAQGIIPGVETATGTVVTSPSQVSTDPLTVQLDGSALAVPVKQFRGFPVFPGMRVGLIKMGSDWVVIGSFTNPGAGTGQMRMAVGADTPPELMAFGVEVAMLMYDTDAATGLEVGYFFIGISNVLDLPPTQKVMLFGKVKYPVAGDPSSPTMGDVKTMHQINMDGYTWFKDGYVDFVSTLSQVRFYTNVFMNGNIFFDAAAQAQFFGSTFHMTGSDLVIQTGVNWQSDSDLLIRSIPTLRGETHEQLVTFTSRTSHTIALAFDHTYATPPNLSFNINNSAGVTTGMQIDAFSVTTTGFTMWIRNVNATAVAWTNVPVQWTAIATS